jgi:cyanate permease
MGIAGLLTIALSVDVPIAFVGVVLWGAGVALAFPLFISAAGEMPNPARTVAFVTTCGYAAFLVGPPLLGFVGHAIGMSNMLWVITAFLAVSFVTAGAARRR